MPWITPPSSLHCKEVGFKGPIILEICYARTNDDILQYCLQAREYLRSLEKQMTPERSDPQ